MKIEITKIEKTNGCFSIWIDETQPFNPDIFYSVISPLEIKGEKRILESFGPAEIIDKINTTNGNFAIHYAFDEFPGTTIYSDDRSLMNKIFNLMISSEKYQEQGSI